MELILKVSDERQTTRDVVVDVDPGHLVAEMADALCRHIGVDAQRMSIVVDRTGAPLEPGSKVADNDLMSGDLIHIGPPVVRPPHEEMPTRAIIADVIAGPDSGLSRPLAPGRYRIGRDDDCDLVLSDPSVSRHHADVIVRDDWSVDVEPVRAASNPATVNDVVIEARVPLTPDDVLGLGGTRLAVREFERSVDEHVDQLGQIDFHRTPYRPPMVRERPDQTIGPIPERPSPRPFQVLAMIAPLAAGLAMFAISRQPQFLLLTLISPIMIGANAIEDRRSGKRNFKQDLARFRERLVDQRRALDEMRHQERLDRLRTAPDLADLARRAEMRTIDLWSRGRDAPDFLRLRLGLGSSQVRYSIELERGGAEDLRKEALEAIAGVDTIDSVPVTVDLPEEGVLGVHGDQQLVDGVLSSLVVQAATLHSPEDLTIVAAIAADRPHEWIKWLPHARSVSSPLPGNHVCTTTKDASVIVSQLIEVAEFRAAAGREEEERRRWPHVLLVVDGVLKPDAAEVSRLLDTIDDVGISVIWLAPSPGRVPRQASSVLGVRDAEGAMMAGRLWSTDSAVDERTLEVEHLRPERAEHIARALAPVRDASTASLSTSIPRTAPLLDVLGVSRPSAQWVAEQWAAEPGYHLRFPVGISADGPLEIDLVENGPHSLIGGTSGSGKSELLQSMVAALAVRHPPDRLNFLFIDYKGGASSKVFERLPHTVGYVTNLSAERSLRALTSLRAELDRRMRVMEGVAQSLAEMLEVAPERAPASLVIVVDEFATLVKEVPEFVAGIVDIAQRGRSLGIHLVLATQRPSGSVNENILANTNLRLSLRMLDRGESTSIVGSPEAADIPVPLRGRGLVRLGPRQLVEFQSAYASAPLMVMEEDQPVLVADFTRTDDSVKSVGPTQQAGARNQLAVVIDAVADASQAANLPEPVKPWREVLDDVVGLGEIAVDTDALGLVPGRHVVVGMIDVPEEQDQRPAIVDLEEGGGWMIFGSGGSGKTTALRTVAASIAATSTTDDVGIIGLDFASRGLGTIAPLPCVVDVATGDDLEAITRHLRVLDAELGRRIALLGRAGAENLTTYNAENEPLPRVVVLIDGFGSLVDRFVNATGIGGVDMVVWGDIVMKLIVSGRQVGIHTVLTSDRYNGVPNVVHSAIAGKLILRHADANAYSAHGVPTARANGLDLPPGRGLWNGHEIVQIAVVSPHDHTARSQADTIEAFARRFGGDRTSLLTSQALPESVSIQEVPSEPSSPREFVIGVEDVTGAPVRVGLEWENLAVTGPPRSGRSTALVTAARALAAQSPIYVIGPPSSPLAGLGPDVVHEDRSAFGKSSTVAEMLERVAKVATMAVPDDPVVLVVDDLDEFDDGSLSASWETIATSESVRLVAALENRSMSGYTQNQAINEVRRSSRLLVLRPSDPQEFNDLVALKSPLRPGTTTPPGRGVLLVDRIPTVIHVAQAT